MKIFISIMLIYWLLTSCTNDYQSTISNQNPISAIDSSINHCFIYNEAGYEETIEIRIIGNKIKGQGNRIEQKNYKIFSLIIEGTIKGNIADMTILTIEKNKEKEALTIYETWELNAKELVVKNRTYLGKQKDLSYTKINCGSTPLDKKDSTLYDYFGGYFEGFAVIAKNGKYGLVDEKGTITIPCKYLDLGVVNEGSIMFYNSALHRKGLLDTKGKILIPSEYMDVHCYNEGLAAFVSEEGKWGFFDREGNIAIPAIYLGVNVFNGELTRHPFNEGLANVQTENGWNYINTKGEIVIQGDYVLAKQFENGKAEVYNSFKSFYINKSGDCIENCD